jgi:hypothetical protein
MILRLDNFKLGIDWWEKYGWGSDYINGEYYEMYSARSAVRKQDVSLSVSKPVHGHG